MILDSLLPEGAHHHAYGSRKHEAHFFDDFCGFISPHHSENVQYVYVGPNRGRYEESTRGNFHYVGPCKGHYEKEQLPPDHTAQNCARCACLLMVMIVVVLVMHTLAQEEPFDCAADFQNWQMGWSDMKKEYCCSTARLGCADASQNIDMSRNPPVPHEPMWLLEWMPDLGIGAKFILTVVLMTMLGCIMGASTLYFWGRYFAKPKRSKTELELVTEVNQMLDRAQATRSEMQVTLMWDTIDDLDLHLTLPDGVDINSGSGEYCGFKLDVDANSNYLETKKKLTTKPIENIVFNNSDGAMPMHGEYKVWVKVFEKHDHVKDANITCTITSGGKREVFHYRILPGVSEMRIRTFKYPPPEQP